MTIAPETTPGPPPAPKDQSRQQLRAAGIACIIVISLWALNLIGGLLYTSASNAGVLGDLLGVSGALFSGLALVGITYAVLVQRDEVAMARYQAGLAKRTFDEQTSHLAAQSFENTFFRMLDLYTGLTNNIEAPVDHSHVRGKDAFRAFAENILSRHKENADSEAALAAYNDFFDEHRAMMAHYFRVLFNIVKFVDAKGGDRTKFYMNIVRAQLSDDELVLLMYNGATHLGRKFRPLMEKHELLDNIPKKKARRTCVHRKYARQAFGDFDETQEGWDEDTPSRGEPA